MLYNFLPVYVAGHVGEITSGGYSPALKQGIGLVRIPSNIVATTAEVEVDGERLQAHIIEPGQIRKKIAQRVLSETADLVE